MNKNSNICINCNNYLNICNNCRKHGHIFNQCKFPIISYGIIAFKYTKYGLKYLMVRRKDTFGYIDFIRGKYSTNNLQQLMNTIDQMTLEEKQKILTEPFEKLWKEMWGDDGPLSIQYKNEENLSKKKYDLLKEGFKIDDKIIKIKDLINLSNTNWNEPEWEFPKGRRNQKEKDIECALREFEEETGINKNFLITIENLLPFEETFVGSNHKSYKYKYFLAFIQHEDEVCNYQKTEISKIEWKTIDECLEIIRPYNLEKKELIKNINKLLQEYRLYL